MNGGCRNPGVPGIGWMCIDWDNARLKFYPTAGGERCMRIKSSQPTTPCVTLAKCTAHMFREVGCNW
ncbi:hypothetical protein B0T16DRAFT_460095 [Cercophora newfieldiana]|uniref:Uncharacterized protein n=1 Tax=Cercophora newfieldiana TaxID=92897 RepID=A0AA39Y102_9PEZI|nr:hypothetical protein B0T16DRAFT_460095 [Cercophora newfieldiana]